MIILKSLNSATSLRFYIRYIFLIISYLPHPQVGDNVKMSNITNTVFECQSSKISGKMSQLERNTDDWVTLPYLECKYVGVINTQTPHSTFSTCFNNFGQKWPEYYQRRNLAKESNGRYMVRNMLYHGIKYQLVVSTHRRSERFIETVAESTRERRLSGIASRSRKTTFGGRLRYVFVSFLWFRLKGVVFRFG